MTYQVSPGAELRGHAAPRVSHTERMLVAVTIYQRTVAAVKSLKTERNKTLYKQ